MSGQVANQGAFTCSSSHCSDWSWVPNALVSPDPYAPFSDVHWRDSLYTREDFTEARDRQSEESSSCLVGVLDWICGVKAEDREHTPNVYRARVYHKLSLTGMHILNVFNPTTINWWDEVGDDVILGAMPLSQAHLESISEVAGAVLSLNLPLEFEGVGLLPPPIQSAAYKAAGLAHKILPVIDRGVPSHAQIREALEFIATEVAKGHKVYVHCMAGRGRSATVVLIYLMVNKGLSYEEARALLRESRYIAAPNHSQVATVKTYAPAKLKMD